MDGSSSDDNVLPKKLLEERRKNAILLRRLKQVRKEKAELQARHDRIEDLFLNKFRTFKLYLPHRVFRSLTTEASTRMFTS
ncbi:hypothetical protein V5799_029944 [Amblyomma americanum]|uniref:Uncharacterized protein n=1 Tax=Amblyomma americanum TaxID=6943 RepID=A0AAQ4EPS5_AMBAM